MFLNFSSDNDNQIKEIVKQLKPYQKSIKDFVPMADAEQRDIYNGLIEFLNAKDADDVDNIVWRHPAFGKYIGAVRGEGITAGGFYVNKIEELATKVLDASKKQKQQKPEEILNEMRDYKTLLENKEQENDKVLCSLQQVLGLTEIILNIAIDKVRITAGSTKSKFKQAAGVIRNLGSNTYNTKREDLRNLDINTLKKLIYNDGLDKGELAKLLAERMVQKQ